jgi:hypothetical protein
MHALKKNSWLDLKENENVMRSNRVAAQTPSQSLGCSDSETQTIEVSLAITVMKADVHIVSVFHVTVE